MYVEPVIIFKYVGEIKTAQVVSADGAIFRANLQAMKRG